MFDSEVSLVQIIPEIARSALSGRESDSCYIGNQPFYFIK